MNQHVLGVLRGIAFLACVAAALGCAGSAGPDRTVDTTSLMEQFKEEATKMKDQIDLALTSLNEIAAKAASGPRPAFDSYISAVSATSSMGESILDRAETMKSKAESYFAEWERETATIQNPEIRKRSEERRGKLFNAYKKVESTSVEARAGLTPFISDLKDIQTLLANDLTPGGIGDAKDLIGKVNSQGGKVKDHIDSLRKEVEKVAAELRISTPAAQ